MDKLAEKRNEEEVLFGGQKSKECLPTRTKGKFLASFTPAPAISTSDLTEFIADVRGGVDIRWGGVDRQFWCRHYPIWLIIGVVST